MASLLERFKSWFTSESKDNVKDVLRRYFTRGFRDTFITDVYKENILYPTEEMKMARKVYDYNAFVQSATDWFVSFLVSEGFYIESKKEELRLFLENYLDNSNLRNLQDEIFGDLIKYGNFYAYRTTRKNGATLYYERIIFPESVYHSLDNKGNVDFYVVELPTEMQHTGTGDYYDIKQIGNRTKTIYGIKYEKDEILHLKIGQASIASYGRGLLATIVNDNSIMFQLERAMAVIARYKSISRKAFIVKDTPENTQNLEEQIKSLEDFQNLITNIEFEVLDMSHDAGNVNFQPIIDYIKRKITVALAPEYAVHGESVNRSTSDDQLIGYKMKALKFRHPIKNKLEKEVKAYLHQSSFSGRFELAMGDIDAGETEKRKEEIRQQWNDGLITLNEAREELELPPDEEVGDFYIWDLRGSQPTVNELLDRESKAKTKTSSRQ